jgi:hypothetical protein
MQKQRIIQVYRYQLRNINSILQNEQQNLHELKKSQAKLRDAENKLKELEYEYEMAGRHADEALKQDDAARARSDSQVNIMKEIDLKLAAVDNKESALLSEFAEYMIEATTHFETAMVGIL